MDAKHDKYLITESGIKTPERQIAMQILGQLRARYQFLGQFSWLLEIQCISFYFIAILFRIFLQYDKYTRSNA